VIADHAACSSTNVRSAKTTTAWYLKVYGGTNRNMPARRTLVLLLALYTNPESHNAQRYRRTDRQISRSSRFSCLWYMNYRFLDFFTFCNVFRSFHTVLCRVHVCCIFIKPFLILRQTEVKRTGVVRVNLHPPCSSDMAPSVSRKDDANGRIGPSTPSHHHHIDVDVSLSSTCWETTCSLTGHRALVMRRLPLSHNAVL